VLADLRRRDERDAGRADAPMLRAPDALLLDTTELTIDARHRGRGGADKQETRRLIEQARGDTAGPSRFDRTLFDPLKDRRRQPDGPEKHYSGD
jgi:hypothetical protein